MEEIKITPLSGESYLVHWSLPEPDGPKNNVLAMYKTRVKNFDLKHPPHSLQAVFTSNEQSKVISLTLKLDREA
jgi:hypothetical protein